MLTEQPCVLICRKREYVTKSTRQSRFSTFGFSYEFLLSKKDGLTLEFRGKTSTPKTTSGKMRIYATNASCLRPDKKRKADRNKLALAA